MAPSLYLPTTPISLPMRSWKRPWMSPEQYWSMVAFSPTSRAPFPINLLTWRSKGQSSRLSADPHTFQCNRCLLKTIPLCRQCLRFPASSTALYGRKPCRRWSRQPRLTTHSRFSFRYASKSRAKRCPSWQPIAIVWLFGIFNGNLRTPTSRTESSCGHRDCQT